MSEYWNSRSILTTIIGPVQHYKDQLIDHLTTIIGPVQHYKDQLIDHWPVSDLILKLCF